MLLWWACRAERLCVGALCDAIVALSQLGSICSLFVSSDEVMMSLLSSRLITTADGGSVHVFLGDDGLVYRVCAGERCVYCNDMATARAHLTYWGRKPHRAGTSDRSPAHVAVN